MKKFEAAVESEKGIRTIEQHPMLNCTPEIPFGARALERGVQIEGIWVSSSETLDQIPKEFTRPNPNSTSRPTTPMTGSPLKMIDINDDGSDPFPRFPAASHATTPSKPVDGNTTSDDGNLSGSSNAPRASQQSYRTVATYPETRASQDLGPRQSRQWFGPRSSWITKPISYKRWSGVSQGGLTTQQFKCNQNGKLIHIGAFIDDHCQSSEEFRRRFSKLFDEQLQVRPVDTFQLNTVPPIAEGSERPYKSHFRSA